MVKHEKLLHLTFFVATSPVPLYSIPSQPTMPVIIYSMYAPQLQASPCMDLNLVVIFWVIIGIIIETQTKLY